VSHYLHGETEYNKKHSGKLAGTQVEMHADSSIRHINTAPFTLFLITSLASWQIAVLPYVNRRTVWEKMWLRKENTENSYCFAADLFGGARAEGGGGEREIKVVMFHWNNCQGSIQNKEIKIPFSCVKGPDIDNARVTVEQAVWMSSSHQHPGGSNYSISPTAVDGRRIDTVRKHC